MKEQDAIPKLEYELASLVRTLEAINRQRRYPLERAHYLLLRYLSQGPMSVGKLAEKLCLDNSTVTRQINAMEKRGLIQKTPNPADGRSALIVTTAAGRDTADDMHALRVKRITALLAHWDPEEIHTLVRLTARLRQDLSQSLHDKP